MKRISTLIAFTFLMVSFASAQKIKGTVKDDLGKPVAGVTVTLKNANDSSLVKLNATNADGIYEFTAIPSGKYFLSYTHVGFEDGGTGVFTVNGAPITLDIDMKKAAAEMAGVTVSSKKPMVQVLADKTVLNVEGSINAVGQDALELLRKSPGVMVDKDENISLSGKNGVQVYIDGRPTPLSGADLAAYLKTMQSSTIESIEIITNPSAKYEAAGNAGIINIKLKKNKAFGTNGSVNAGYGQEYYPKFNGGISWNHRNKNVNIFGTYNVNRNTNRNFMGLYREQLDTLFDQNSVMRSEGEFHSFKAGMDFNLSSRSILGLMVTGNRGNNVFSNESLTDISYIPTKLQDRTLVADNDSRMKRSNTNFNMNYRFADTSGRELNIDADYGYFNIHSDQMQRNYYFQPSGDPLDERIYNFIAPTDIDIFSLKADYEQNVKGGRLGFGGKSSFVRTQNDFDRYDVLGNTKSYDSTRSNGFDYLENINALYVNYNKQFKNVMIQFGLRMEQTMSEGTSNGFEYVGNGTGTFEPTSEKFKRNYVNLFPSGAITFNKNPESQWGLRYSRRIDRPAYQDLNPFEFKLDEYTFQKGNTELRPQYTNSFALTHTYKFRLNTTLNYSHVNDVFTQLIDTAELSKSFITKKNLAEQDVVSLNVSYPFQYKSYSAFGNLNASYSHYTANFGEGRTIDLDAYAFNIYMQHTYKFAKVYTAELSGFYNSPSIWQGTFESRAMWGVDAGIMRSLWDNKGNIKISLGDIFNTMRWGGESNFAGQYIFARGGWESRQFRVNFTYRFGSNTVKAARQRKTSLEEESQRASGSQGGGIGQ